MFKSGEEYSIAKLFTGDSEDHKLVIPDLQRDYCWGDYSVRNNGKNTKQELVSGFYDNLFQVLLSEDDLNKGIMLGLIYGYKDLTGRIQICDGQQRITTLFLMLGMLYREIPDGETPANEFKNCLISKFEISDDKEPRLQYSIRESTLYFLSDLVCEFFLKQGLKVDDIRSQSWYFKEYDLDASIQSMISAIKIIETKMNSTKKDVDYLKIFEKFGEGLLHKLTILYYDMGDRRRGEETFVVINTTGEPLTASENLKPILIGNIIDEKTRQTFSSDWEDREHWFWENKPDRELTADEGLKDFHIWYWQLRLLQEKSWVNKKAYDLKPIELFIKKPLVDFDNEEIPNIKNWGISKNPETIHSYFTALTKLVELSKNIEVLDLLSTISKSDKIDLDWFRSKIKSDLNVILPLLAYLEKFKEPNFFIDFVRRIRKNYFDVKMKHRNVNKIDWRHIVQIIEFANSEEAVLNYKTKENEKEFKKISNVDLNEWFNEEEKWKNTLKKDAENQLKKWEDHPDFMGDLEPLKTVSESSNDVSELECYFDFYLTPKKLGNEKFNKSLENLIRISFFIDNGSFEHRTLAGSGYCMLVENNNIPFLLKDYNVFWRLLVKNRSNDEELIQHLKNKIRVYFEFNESNDFIWHKDKVENYGVIRIWSLLEYLDFEEIDFKDSISIACFWSSDKMLINKNIDNKIQIGNFTLGRSWSNNKSGAFDYKMRLMSEAHDNQKAILAQEINQEINRKIVSNTKEYIDKINCFFSQN